MLQKVSCLLIVDEFFQKNVKSILIIFLKDRSTKQLTELNFGFRFLHHVVDDSWGEFRNIFLHFLVGHQTLEETYQGLFRRWIFHDVFEKDECLGENRRVSKKILNQFLRKNIHLMPDTLWTEWRVRLDDDLQFDEKRCDYLVPDCSWPHRRLVLPFDSSKVFERRTERAPWRQRQCLNRWSTLWQHRAALESVDVEERDRRFHPESTETVNSLSIPSWVRRLSHCSWSVGEIERRFAGKEYSLGEEDTISSTSWREKKLMRSLFSRKKHSNGYDSFYVDVKVCFHYTSNPNIHCRKGNTSNREGEDEMLPDVS